MGAWPDLYVPAAPTITPWSVLESLGSGLSQLTQEFQVAASTVWPSANLALYVPFLLGERATATQMFVYNGAAVSGNVDAGIYSEDGTKIVSMGSTAQAGTSAIQTLNITDTVIGPGLFYMALVLDNGTGTVLAGNPSADSLRAMGMLQQATAFALPATATFATMAQAYVPVFGILFTRSTL